MDWSNENWAYVKDQVLHTAYAQAWRQTGDLVRDLAWDKVRITLLDRVRAVFNKKVRAMFLAVEAPYTSIQFQIRDEVDAQVEQVNDQIIEASNKEFYTTKFSFKPTIKP